ncbi:MAG: hypothetical protein AAF674_09040 [Pseudomonadota bacterium]
MTDQKTPETIADTDLDQAEGGVTITHDHMTTGGMVSVQIDHNHMPTGGQIGVTIDHNHMPQQDDVAVTINHNQMPTGIGVTNDH